MVIRAGPVRQSPRENQPMQSSTRRWQRPPSERARPLFDLFDRPPPANRSSTSRAAAESISGHVAAQRERVLAALRNAGEQGATADELQVLLEIGPQSLCPRLLELREAGLAIEAGRTRLTRRGRAAKVYLAITPKEPTDGTARR